MANYGRVEKFIENNSVSVGAGLTATIFTLNIPSKCIMRLKSFGNYIDIVAAWGNITWRFLHNGIRVFPYDAIRDQIGYAAQRQPIREIELTPGVFEIVGVSAHGVAVAVGVSLEWELIYQE